mmetsp:Transcript_51333/g.133392  ORF Transcript_51333/g.133392 Transcript_51333/m.133392 type:complete len:208 (+) Transcript_51333:436-1059(+)
MARSAVASVRLRMSMRGGTCSSVATWATPGASRVSICTVPIRVLSSSRERNSLMSDEEACAASEPVSVIPRFASECRRSASAMSVAQCFGARIPSNAWKVAGASGGGASSTSATIWLTACADSLLGSVAGSRSKRFASVNASIGLNWPIQPAPPGFGMTAFDHASVRAITSSACAPRAFSASGVSSRSVLTAYRDSGCSKGPIFIRS